MALEQISQATLYDFLDLGCSTLGRSLLARRLNLVSGLGVDRDPNRVARFRELGFEGLVKDVTELTGLRQGVRVVFVSHALHKLASRKAASDVLQEAVSAAREAVVVIQPWFDSNPLLMSLGLKLFHADRARHTNLATSYDLWLSLRGNVEAGEGALAIFGRKRIADSSHPAVVPLSAPADIAEPKAGTVRERPPVGFQAPVFEELVAIWVVKSRDGAFAANWQALADSLGQCELVALHGDVRPPPPSPLAAQSSKRVAHAAAEHRPLFVCGVPRSGTTAVTRLLNAHPKIGIGVERYRSRLTIGLTPDLFERVRFFKYEEDDGARDVFEKFAEEYARLKAKWNRCLYVGDKIPRLYRRFDPLYAAFPNATVVCITRDVLPVCASWQRRADDPNDRSWPPSNDALAAVREWNDGQRAILDQARQRPESFFVTRYEDIFSGNAKTLRTLLARLQLDFPKGTSAAYRTLLAEERTESLDLSASVRDQILANADRTAQVALDALVI